MKGPVFKCKRAANGTWSSVANQQRFLTEHVMPALQISKLDDWYTIKPTDVRKNGGSGLLNLHGNSLVRALVSLYPSHKWSLDKFRHMPRRYWDSVEAQRIRFDAVGMKLQLKTLCDWYNVSHADAVQSGAGAILSTRYGALSHALREIYPDFQWDTKKLRKAAKKRIVEVPRLKRLPGQDNTKVVEALRALEVELGIVEPDGWYDHSVASISRRKNKLLAHYPWCLRLLHPNHKWNMTYFMEEGSRRLYLEKRKVLSILTAVKDELNVTSPAEWYRVSNYQLIMYGGKLLSRYYPACLQWLYPGYDWMFWKFQLQRKRSNQRALLLGVTELCVTQNSTGK